MNTPDPVKDLLALAQKNGYPLDEEGARLYLENRIALGKTPTDPEVRRVAQHFENHVFRSRPLTDFLDGKWEEGRDCPECLAFDSRYSERLYIATLMRNDGMTLERAQALAQEAIQNILARSAGVVLREPEFSPNART